MDNAAALNHAVRTHHLRYRDDRGDLGDRNAGLFEFGCNRSTAASGRASRGGEDDRIDPLRFELRGDFPTQSAAIGQRISQA